jgi:hypothetical protein
MNNKLSTLSPSKERPRIKPRPAFAPAEQLPLKEDVYQQI